MMSNFFTVFLYLWCLDHCIFHFVLPKSNPITVCSSFKLHCTIVFLLVYSHLHMKYNYVSHDSNVFERIEREIVFLRDFHTFVTNVTVDSSSRSQRLSDLHIFYATFFPAFFVVICVFLGVGCYLWMRHKGELPYLLFQVT